MGAECWGVRHAVSLVSHSLRKPYTGVTCPSLVRTGQLSRKKIIVTSRSFRKVSHK